MTFTCKNYNITGGLSQQLHSSNDQKTFCVQGPMGRGLGLSGRGIEGTYIAFAVGTGVLVFMDLVAYLVRYNLDLIGSDEKV